MNKHLSHLVLFVVMCTGGSVLHATPLTSAPDLHSYEELTGALRDLQREHSEVVRLTELAQSREERSVWLVEVGTGSDEDRLRQPGILLVAGIEGDQLAGTEITLAFLRQLAAQYSADSVTESLRDTTFYVIPRLNPDGAERYFMQPVQQIPHNTTPVDQDHDGFTDEDGADDLDGDGFITSVRIRDVKGKYIIHPDEPRLIVEADAIKGEVGEWILIDEGKDNDGDEEINEDPPGGVHFNQHFPYNYEWFKDYTGTYPLHEKITRALAEFVVNHPGIGLVFTYAEQDNLLSAPEGGEQSSGRQPQTTVRNEDVKWIRELSEQYRQILNISGNVNHNTNSATLANWFYFHRGRLALSARVWSPEIALALKEAEMAESEEEKNKEKSLDKPKSDEQQDESLKAEKPVKKATEATETDTGEKDSDHAADAERKVDERARTEREYLAWLDENAPDYFVSWNDIEHPDFPGQEAQVGGFAPHAKVLPPASMLEALMEKHIEFLNRLPEKLPRVEIYDVKSKHLGKGIYDITLQIRNRGYLPTVLAHGVRTGEVVPTRVIVHLDDKHILAGQKRQMLSPLSGSGEVVELRYTIRKPEDGRVRLELVSALAGQAERVIELNEE
ncbi:MAG: M14 family zinc carboxypeptidase [bacterium]